MGPSSGCPHRFRGFTCSTFSDTLYLPSCGHGSVQPYDRKTIEKEMKHVAINCT